MDVETWKKIKIYEKYMKEYYIQAHENTFKIIV